MRFLRQYFIFSALFFTFSQFCIAIPVISNVSSWNGASSIGTFGTGGTETYGQVFTPTGLQTALDSFSIIIGRTALVSFQAYIQPFSNATDASTGPILFTSGILSNTVGPGFETISVATGGLQLVANTSYIAYFSAASQPETETAIEFAVLPSPPANANLGGFHFSNSDLFDPVTGPPNPWGTFGDFGQLAFTANLSAPSAVPEIDASVGTIPIAIFLSLFLLLGDRRRRPVGQALNC